jgi:hypothetical protein
MQRHRILSGLILAAVLVAPAFTAASAGAEDRRTQPERRVYDRGHKDYHVWDAREDQTYRGYLTEHHLKYRAFSRQSRTSQATYWRYRHQ